MDFADAVVDLILSVQTMMIGAEGAGVGLGVVILIATIFGRVLSTLYGRVQKEHPYKGGAFEQFF